MLLDDRDLIAEEGTTASFPSAIRSLRFAGRDTPMIRAEKGALDLNPLARDIAHEILANHHPRYLSGEVDRRIRERFDIFLSSEDLRAVGIAS